MILRSLTALLLITAAACSEEPAESPPSPSLMTWSDLTDRLLPQPQMTLRYADQDAGVIDLWLPSGDGPHPTVVMIHGGCWQKAIADRTLMNYAAEALRQEGLAVWNIEYRGVDEPGGGYPGTFLDVAAAVDTLPAYADEYGLDIAHVVAIGHSAGGHLAAWASVRENLSEVSPLYTDDPFPLRTVISSGGLVDLVASEPVTLPTCLGAIREQLTGAPSDARPDVYTDTSPVTLQPSQAEQISVHGAQDRIAPPLLAEGYTAIVEASGGRARTIILEDTGHVELVAPGTVAFNAQTKLILQALDKSGTGEN